MVYFFSGTEQALAMLLSDHFCLCVCPGSDIAALFEQTDNLNDLISPYWRRQRSECSNFCRAVFSFLFIVVFVSLNRASVGFQEPIFLSFFLYSHCITMCHAEWRQSSVDAVVCHPVPFPALEHPKSFE